MSSEQTDPVVTQLYRLAAHEHAPGALDARILQAADRHARRRRLRARLPWVAASMLVALLIFSHDRASHPGAMTITGAGVASPAAQAQVRNYLLNLRIAEIDQSKVGVCLRSRDVCTHHSGAYTPIDL